MCCSLSLDSDLAVRSRMLDAERSSHVNKATLATTLILKASRPHRDESVELEIRWVDEVTRSTTHAVRVPVDNFNDTEIGIIELNGVCDLLAVSVLVDTIDRLGGTSIA